MTITTKTHTTDTPTGPIEALIESHLTHAAIAIDVLAPSNAKTATHQCCAKLRALIAAHRRGR